MTIEVEDVARGVGAVLNNPRLRDLISPEGQQLVDYVTREVLATESPSGLVPGGNPLDMMLRRKILARMITLVALNASEYGEEKRTKEFLDTGSSELPSNNAPKAKNVGGGVFIAARTAPRTAVITPKRQS